MKKYLLILILFLSSCYTKQAALNKFGCKEDRVETKIETKEVIRNVEIKIPGDSIPFFLPCDELKPKEGKNGRSSYKAIPNKQKNGYDIVSSCDSLTKTIEAKDRVINMYRETIVKDSYKEGDKVTWLGKKLQEGWDILKTILAFLGLVWVLKLIFRFK